MTGVVSYIRQSTWVSALMNTQIPNWPADSELQPAGSGDVAQSVLRSEQAVSGQIIHDRLGFVCNKRRVAAILVVAS